MQDRLHPETSAAAGLLVALIIAICKKFGVEVDSENASQLTILAMWLANRLARKFFPEESMDAAGITSLTIKQAEDSAPAKK